jgi:hypothetical protein
VPLWQNFFARVKKYNSPLKISRRAFSPMQKKSPHKLGWKLIGAFLIFGCSMLVLSATFLSFPDWSLSSVFWNLRPDVKLQLDAIGWPVIAGFFSLSVIFAFAAVGWFRKRKWGWVMAVILIGGNLVGDISQMFAGKILEGCVGIVFGGALMLYLCSWYIRGNFQKN